jgi:hypothetical protein
LFTYAQTFGPFTAALAPIVLAFQTKSTVKSLNELIDIQVRLFEIINWQIGFFIFLSAEDSEEEKTSLQKLNTFNC